VLTVIGESSDTDHHGGSVFSGDKYFEYSSLLEWITMRGGLIARMGRSRNVGTVHHEIAGNGEVRGHRLIDVRLALNRPIVAVIVR
jgi:hypothetical protein